MKKTWEYLSVQLIVFVESKTLTHLKRQKTRKKANNRLFRNWSYLIEPSLVFLLESLAYWPHSFHVHSFCTSVRVVNGPAAFRPCFESTGQISSFFHRLYLSFCSQGLTWRSCSSESTHKRLSFSLGQDPSQTHEPEAGQTLVFIYLLILGEN